MSGRGTPRLVGLALALASALLATSASAQQANVDEARRRFTQGTALYQRGEYQAAFAEFEAAYRASPHPAILFNMAQCQVQLGRRAEAIRLLERLLAAGVEPATADEVRRTIERLRAQPGP